MESLESYGYSYHFGRDTIKPLGISKPRIPVLNLDTVKAFRHALALDERRVQFTPCLYRKTTCMHTKKTEMKKRETARASSGHAQIDAGEGDRGVSVVARTVRDTEPTGVLEVWFPGCHDGQTGTLAPCALSILTEPICLQTLVAQSLKQLCMSLHAHPCVG